MLSDHEKFELKRVQTVIDAACQNSAVHNEVRIETTGVHPHASVTIPACILAPIIAKALREEHG